MNWIASLFCSEPSNGFLSRSKEKKKNPNSSSWHPRPHQRGSLTSLSVFMSCHSLGLPRLFVPRWPCSCLWDFAEAVPSAWNTLPSSLYHKVGSLHVSFRCQCLLLGEVSFPAFPKNTSTSYPRPVSQSTYSALFFFKALGSSLHYTIGLFASLVILCLYQVNSTGAKTFCLLYLRYLVAMVPRKSAWKR